MAQNKSKKEKTPQLPKGIKKLVFKRWKPPKTTKAQAEVIALAQENQRQNVRRFNTRVFVST